MYDVIIDKSTRSTLQTKKDQLVEMLFIPNSFYLVNILSLVLEKYEIYAFKFAMFFLAPGRFKLSTTGWFWGIWVSLLLIILLLVLFIFLKRVRDEYWELKGRFLFRTL